MEPFHWTNKANDIAGPYTRGGSVIWVGILYRSFLITYCKNIISLGKKNTLEVDKPATEDVKNTIPNSDLFQNKFLTTIQDHRWRTVLKSLFDQEYPLELAKTIAQLIINLNGTAALTNFFPLKDHGGWSSR